MMSPVALVLVSHSRALAAGAAELAGQMAPDVLVLPAGGTSDGRLGTGFDVVEAAVLRAGTAPAGAVLLTDLGSAAMTAETVLEVLSERDASLLSRFRMVDAPFVEGAVAAAVAAQSGADLEEVARAAAGAAGFFSALPAATPLRASVCAGTVLRAVVVLADPQGLHARPAAALAAALAPLDADVRIDGADGRSVLELMALRTVGGHEVRVEAWGPAAERALALAVAALRTPAERWT